MAKLIRRLTVVLILVALVAMVRQFHEFIHLSSSSSSSATTSSLADRYRVTRSFAETRASYNQKEPHQNVEYAFQLRGMPPLTSYVKGGPSPPPSEPYNEYALQRYIHSQRVALLNESTVLSMMKPKPGEPLKKAFEGEMDFIESAEARDAIYSNPNLDLVWDFWLCSTVRTYFRKHNTTKPHVVISYIDPNWGAFSQLVPNRTVDWTKHGNWPEERLERLGCTVEEFWRYINHPNVKAVFTTSHQSAVPYPHPKIHTVPLGVSSAQVVSSALHSGKMRNRTKLLMINMSDYQHRVSIAKSVIANFNETLQNTYPQRPTNKYFQELQESKYILCPSGLGWDTYRAWEALMMGTIPIMETYYRNDGFYQAYNDLPLLWVDHFDNVTPALLERAYPKILSHAREYKFEKLTTQWWIDYINSFRPTKQDKTP